MRLVLVTGLASFLALHARAACVNSVTEARLAPDSAYAGQTPFRFQGKVVANGYANSALLEDHTGRTCLFFDLPDKSVPAAGDVVTASGILKTDNARNRILQATAYAVLRHEVPPEPQTMTLAEALQQTDSPRYIRVSGTLVEVCTDEVDSRFIQCVLYADDCVLNFSVSSRAYPLEKLRKLTNAEISVAGVSSFNRRGSWRKFAPPSIGPVSELSVIRPPPADQTDIEPLENAQHIHDFSPPLGSRRRAEGRVLVAWMGNRILLKTVNGLLIRAHLASGQPLPRTGDSVTIAGLIDTDGLNLLMFDASVKQNGNLPKCPESAPLHLSSKDIFLTKDRLHVIRPDLDGKVIRLEGCVIAITKTDNASTRILLESDGYTIPVEVSGHPSVEQDATVGCKVAVSGIFVVEADRLERLTVLPHLRNVLLIIRSPDDIIVLARPPWWTTRVLLGIIGGLLLVIVTVLVWNRALRILVDRKSREVVKAQTKKIESELRIGERTRLAADLHDNTVQNLTAIAYRITAAQGALGEREPEAGRILDVAAKMLKSCRTSLRQCLWDLRNDALNETDFGTAIRRTVEPVAGDARLSVRFSGRRDLINDTTAHAILSILRELVANATVHGNAGSVSIAGEAHPGVIRFSVSDNGTGFDPAHRPGQDEGHFGIDGIQERLESLGGTMDIESSARKGTYVRITIQRT